MSDNDNNGKLDNKIQDITDKHDQSMALLDLRSNFYDSFYDALGANGGERADRVYSMFIEFLRTCKAEGVEPLQVLQVPPREPSE
jgi:hypothetical protein